MDHLLPENTNEFSPSEPNLIPPVWHVEGSYKNYNYQGSERIVQSLTEALNLGKPVIVTGTELGVGTTQATLEYAKDTSILGSKYGIVLFFETDSLENPDIQKTIDRLNQFSDWLLVINDHENPSELISRLPQNGDIIIVSKIKLSQDDNNQFTEVQIPPLPRPESINFIEQRTGQIDFANELANQLGDLPLALDLACHYIERTSLSLENYSRMLKEQENGVHHLPDSLHKIARPCNLLIASLTLTNPSALSFVKLIAAENFELISKDGILERKDSLPLAAREFLENQQTLDKAVQIVHPLIMSPSLWNLKMNPSIRMILHHLFEGDEEFATLQNILRK